MICRNTLPGGSRHSTKWQVPRQMTPMQVAVYLGANTPRRLVHARGCSLFAAYSFLSAAKRRGELTKDGDGRYHLPVVDEEPPKGAVRYGVRPDAPMDDTNEGERS